MNSLEIFKNDRMNTIMEKYNIDVLVASSSGNVFYLSGFESHKINSTAQVYFLYDRKNDQRVVVAPYANIPTILEIINVNIKVYCYGEFYFAFNHKNKETIYEKINKLSKKKYNSPDEALIAAIEDNGIKKGTIGLDESKVNPQTWEKLHSKFPSINFYPAVKVFAEIRKIKHPNEISLIEKSTMIAEESLVEIIKNINIGQTEEEIGKNYIMEVTKRKGFPNFNVVTIDERSAYSDTINTSRAIKEGSVIRFDVGCIYQGYCSDMARTVVIGNCNKKYKEYYDYLLDGEEKTINAIKPGVTAQELFEIAVKTVRKGIPHYRRNHCGHGIGIDGYNPPIIASGIRDTIEKNMVLCIETPYYELGWCGMQVEDTIVVEDNGHRLLTKSDRNLIVK